MNYSIIIPVLNEEKNLSKLIPEIFFRLKKVSFELIIIDDNSEDNTSILIRKLKRKNLRYFIRKKDKDLSRACIYGFNKKELYQYGKQNKKSYLEKIEDIELLRFLDFNIPIKMIKVSNRSIAVDIKNDIKKVEIFLKK